MYVMVATALALALMAVCGSGMQSNLDNTQRMQGENANAVVSTVSNAVQQYYEEYGVFPATLSALAATPGYEYVSTILTVTNQNSFGYLRTTSPISDGVWQFDRAVVFTLKAQLGQTVADYANVNLCGSGPITTASSWCGSRDSFWARLETRDQHVKSLIAERLRQQRLMQKFANAYNGSSTSQFPDAGGTAPTLASLVSYGGTAKTCAGSFSWAGIPIGCDDMYSVWGTPTVLNQITRTHIALLAESTIKDASGSLVNVATDMNLDQ